MSEDADDAMDLLRRCREFIGTRTSEERQVSSETYDLYIYPISEGDRLRREADLADRLDRLILDLRKALEEKP